MMQYSTDTEQMVNDMGNDLGGDFTSDDDNAWAGLSDNGDKIDVTQVIQDALMKGINDGEEVSEEELTALLEQIMEGETTLAEIKGLSADALELLYSIAHQFYTAGNYERASQFFQNLMLLNHWDVRFTFGLAACMQAQKYYEEALNVYSALYFMDAKNPEIFLNAGICRLALGNKEEAEDAFFMALEMSRDKAEYKNTFERAEGLLEHVKAVKGKKSAKKDKVAEPEHTHAKKKED
jgi:type III secretion system low calcium response chaperone LcrH/SycD